MSTTITENDIAEITFDFGEREIYNDIRSECDVTEILHVRPDATPDLFLSFETSAWGWTIYANSTTYVTATADEDHSEISWLGITDYSFSPKTLLGLSEAECAALGTGNWRYSSKMETSLCMLDQSVVEDYVSWEVYSQDDTTFTIEVTNDSSYDIRGVWKVAYLALTPATRYLKLRSTNDTSIAKYGRRVMDLRWYVGQTPNQMQSIIDGYCDKYAEPVPFVNLVLLGKTDSLVTKILGLKMDDTITLRLPGLNVYGYFILNTDRLDEGYLGVEGLTLNDEFWVNNVSISHDVNGIMEGIFDLANVRGLERYTYFELDVSKLDEDYLAA
jgi:hypothetical protein